MTTPPGRGARSSDRGAEPAAVPASTRAFLWFLVVAGGVFGAAFVVMAIAGLAQGVDWWLALVLAVVGLVMLLGAARTGRLLLRYRYARREHAAAEAEFRAAAEEARTRLGLDDDPRSR